MQDSKLIHSLDIDYTRPSLVPIADNSHFSYQNEYDLVDFIASEMRNEGLDPNDEANLDSYLTTKFM